MKNEQKVPAVSVLIPVYNAAPTLERCLHSVIGQTMRNIEIICVDDGSDEKTKAELARLAATDARIRVITHETNRGTMATRKRLIEEALGNYIMFLDSDDEFYPQACEKAYETITNRKADIVQFGVENLYEEGYPEKYRTFQRFESPNETELRDEAIFSEAFKEKKIKKYAWTLWCRIYQAELLRRVVPFMPDEKIIMAEDFFINFIAFGNAKRCVKIKDVLVRYRFGCGVSTNCKWDADQCLKLGTEGLVYSALDKYIKARGLRGAAHEQILIEIRRQRLKDMLYGYKTHCFGVSRRLLFDGLLRYFPPAEIASALADAYGMDVSDLMKVAYTSKMLKVPPHAVKRIGFFYFRLYNGGVERVISELIPKFIEWGYETYLFVEEQNSNDYPLPNECKKIVLPLSSAPDARWGNVGGKSYAAHVFDLCEALSRYHIDALLYQATSAPVFFYDMLAAKAMGVYVSGTLHEIMSMPLRFNFSKAMFPSKINALRVADGAQTILKGDGLFLKAIGCNAHFIPNPTIKPVGKGEEKKNSIIWVGRMESEVKRPEHAFYIMKKVVQSIPEARLYMVGTAETAAENQRYKDLIKKLGLKKNIVLCGFCKDVTKYYTQASVLLSTSAFESWGMVLTESMAHGLPIVCYEMPYLEPLKNNGGCITVAQEDIDGAADAVVRILQDGALRKKMSEAALAKAEELYNADLRGAWEKMFDSFGQSRTESETEKDLRVSMETMLDFYQKGIKNEPGGAESTFLPGQSLFKKAALFWVDKGTFALIRKGMLYFYKKIRRRR